MRTGDFVASVHVSEYSFGRLFVRDDALRSSQQLGNLIGTVPYTCNLKSSFAFL